MSRDPIPTWSFVLAVVRKENMFLLIRESKHGGGWYVPAGRVDPGESYIHAVERETMEEAGIPIHVQGILRIEHDYSKSSHRLRYIFLAETVDDTPPKDYADSESEEAGRFTLEEIASLPLRGREVLSMLTAVERDPTHAPASLICTEGAAW